MEAVDGGEGLGHRNADGPASCAGLKGLEEEEEEEWISLKRIVCAFGVGINEEQAWAILHQTATSYVRSWPKIDTGISDDVTSASLCLPELDKLLLNKDGAVLIEHRHAHNKLNGHEDRIRETTTEESFLQTLAFTIFEACDYGLNEKEEAHISGQLSALLEGMGNADVPVGGERCCSAEPVDWIEPGHGSEEDERDAASHCVPNSSNTANSSGISAMEKVLRVCRARCVNPGHLAEEHYRAVCRAVVVECSDLLEFLERVHSQERLRTFSPMTSGKQQLVAPKIAVIDEFRDWAKLWMQVVGKLREGVQLREVSTCLANRGPVVYELTPYEVLMEDIRMRRYSLKNPPARSESPRARLDAHDIILDYIRSRPSLSPAQNRILNPKREDHTPVDLLLNSIRQFSFSSLRPTQAKAPLRTKESPDKSMWSSEAVLHLGKSDEMAAGVGGVGGCNWKRRLVLPDEHVMPPPADFSTILTTDLQAVVEDETESDVECDERSECGDSHSSRLQDERASRMKRCYSEVVSLTLDEIALIRGALAKAELDNLEEQNINLYNDIRRSKVCFTCKRAKFSYWLFRQIGVKCHLCQNTICSSCVRQMILPCQRLDRIPVHTLSPTIAPEDQPFPHQPQPQPQPTIDQSLLNKRPLSSHSAYSSTLPRPKVQRGGGGAASLQRSFTQDFSSWTLPKPQSRSCHRPALQRGMSMDGITPPPDARTSADTKTESNFVMQVCVDCHSVLYHAIVESQMQLASIYISQPMLQHFSSHSQFNREVREDKMAIRTCTSRHSLSPHLSRDKAPASVSGHSDRASNLGVVVSTRNSSVVSDCHSRSDSLEDAEEEEEEEGDLNGDEDEEMDDFLCSTSSHMDVQMESHSQAISPALSLSSTSSDGHSASHPAPLYLTNHI